MTDKNEKRFNNSIPTEWNYHDLVHPESKEMSRLIASFIKEHFSQGTILEIGCGTGDTTTELLQDSSNMQIIGVDNEPKMLSLAGSRFQSEIASNKIKLIERNAFDALLELDTASIEVVASVYTLHNIKTTVRREIISEIFRVLKPGGLFLNGDRYWPDDPQEQLVATMTDVERFFEVMITHNQLDLLRDWIKHYFQDISREYSMLVSDEITYMQDLGFEQINKKSLGRFNLLVSATKN